MHKQKLITLAVLLCSGFSVWAGNIKGVVSDAQGPIPAADVLLYKASDTTKIYKTGLSDDDGNFDFDNVPVGKYMVKVEFMGYKDKRIHITLTAQKPSINAMKIKMQDDTQMLSSVEIVGQRTAMKVDADKKTFMVNASAVTEGVSVSDVLNEVPTVNVDVEGNISLRNNENVVVYINGKPAGLTDDNRGDILEQLPANSIEKVEVITNPSSKYNAEGEAGIINIVMKEDHRKGYYGSVTAGLNYPWESKLGGNVGASLSYTTGKWDLSGSLGVQRRTTEGERKRDRRMFHDGDTTYTYTHDPNQRNMTTGFLNLGASYNIDKRNVLSWKGMGSIADRHNKDPYSYTYGTIENGKHIADSYAKSNDTVDSERDVFSTSLDYNHKFLKEGEELSASASFATNKNDRDAVYDMYDQDIDHQLIEDSKDVKKEHQLRKMRNEIFQLDYTLPTSETGKFESGAKADLRNDHNDANTQQKKGSATTFTDRQDLDNDFEIQQNVYALYATYSDVLAKKLRYNVGLRGELTDMHWEQHTIGDKSSKDPYFNLFPSAFLSYKLHNDGELQFNYTRRVSRPQMRRLNPYVNVSDSANISFGNPDLDPELTHSLELNYILTKGDNMYTASVYYKNTKDVVSRYNWTENGILKTTYGNMSHSQQVGLELIAKQKVVKGFTLTGNINLYYYDLAGGWFDINVTNSSDGKIYTQKVHLNENNSFSWTGKLNADILLPWDMSGQVSAEYHSPCASSQGKNHHLFTSNAAIKRAFLNHKLTVSLSCRDIFNSYKFKNRTYGTNFDQENTFSRSGRTLLLNLSYNFGSMGGAKKGDKGDFKEKESLDDLDDISFIDLTPRMMKLLGDDTESGIF